jgi:NADH-quinone oxidoreductase E subunit
MALAFSTKTQKKIQDLLKRYPTKQAACLPLLYFAQEEFGYVSKDALELVASTLDISFAHVYGVSTFYTMFNKKPVGKYHIQLCQTLSCSVLGSENILAYIEKKLNIKPGETTPDGRFTLSTVECLASCGTGPMIQINRTYYENLTPEKIDDLLDSFE